MCQCVTSKDLLNKINDRRSKRGLEKVNYAWLMIQNRGLVEFFPPIGKIGNSYVWDKRTANRLVSSLWDKNYRSNSFRWENYHKMAG